MEKMVFLSLRDKFGSAQGIKVQFAMLMTSPMFTNGFSGPSQNQRHIRRVEETLRRNSLCGILERIQTLYLNLMT